MDDYKILVTGPSWIGDMIMAQSLFMWIHKTIPRSSIDVLAPLWALPVVERMQEVRKGIAFPSSHGKLDLSMRIKTGISLKPEKYNEAIIIPRTLKSILPAVVAGIKKRTAFRSHFGLINNVRYFSRSRQELFVRRYLSLVTEDAYSIPIESIPKPELSIDKKNSARLITEFKLEAKRFVAIAPSAEFGPAKQWPIEYFATLAKKIIQRGYKVVILGAQKDKKVADEIIRKADSVDVISLCGKTSLVDVIDLMPEARLVLTNDSGLMHLAAATATRLFAFFGSTSSLYTPPLAEPENYHLFTTDIDCRPCFARTCRYGHYDCLKRILPGFVFERIEDELP